MNATRLPVRLAAAAVLLGATLAAHAGMTTTTSQTGFAALAGAAVDNFSDLTINTDLGSTTLARAAGPYTYSASTETSLYVAPVASAIALSTTNFSDTLTLGQFGSPVRAIGANFYGTNILGEVASGALTLTATDVNGFSLTASLAGGSASGFLGFVSDADLVSLTVSMATPGTNVFASLDNVTLSAVPEPGSWALMLGGSVLLMGAAARRRG